jgi:hypothetical protein
VRGSRRAVGLASEGRGDSSPCNGETPSEPWPPTAGHTLAAYPLGRSRPTSLFAAWAVKPRRAGGAPLKSWRKLSLVKVAAVVPEG